MLETLDTVIALVVVLLGLSLVITALNQAIAALLNLRGRNLLWGLGTLLEQVHPQKMNTPSKGNPEETVGRRTARSILEHKLLSHSMFSGFVGMFRHLAFPSALRYDEFVGVLELSGKSVPKAGTADSDGVEWLNANLEVTREWFDHVMDRASQRFGSHMRLMTVGFAFLVAIILHVDTVSLVRHLSEDSELRSVLVAEVSVIQRQTTVALEDPNPELEAALERLAEIRETVSQPRLSLIGSGAPIHGFWQWDLWTGGGWHVAGMLLTTLLLSLGAPFWFNLLKSLMNLRSVVAQKEEKDRMTRSTDASRSAIEMRDL